MDEIPMEIYLELDDAALGLIPVIVNSWWDNEEMSVDEMEARVVLIFKKCSTAMFEKCRPISLLNTIYKIKAAILQKRIEEGIDQHLQRTLYGFREQRGAADAIALIRRVMEYSEATQDRTLFLLLDWEKAFGKARHEALLIAL